MKKIEVLLTGVENYCQFQEPREFLFENGITIISGPNGKGKTNLLDSVGFTWYGTTTKGLRGPDIVNRRSGKNCHTWTKFRTLEPEEEYRIDRYYDHKEFGCGVHVWREGDKDPIETKTSESNKLIEKLTLPSKLFFNRISFGQKIKSFFTNLNQGDQRDIFRKLFALEMYEMWYKQTEKDLEIEDKILQEIIILIKTKSSLLEREKELLDQIKEEKKEFYISKKEKLDTILQNINEKRNQENSLSLLVSSFNETNCDEDFYEIKSKITILKEDLSKIESTKQDKSTTIKENFISRKEQIISNINSSYLSEEKKFILEKTNIEKEKSETTYNLKKKISDLKNNLDTINNNISANKNQADPLRDEIFIWKDKLEKSVCPTCKEHIRGETKAELENNLKEKERLLVNIRKKIEEDSYKKTKIISEIKNSEIELKEYSENISEKIEEVNKKISILKTEASSKITLEIEKLKIEFQDKLSVINNDLDMKEKEIKEKLEKHNIEIVKLSKIIEEKELHEKTHQKIVNEIFLELKNYDYEYKREFDENKINQIEMNVNKLKFDLKSEEERKYKKEKAIKILTNVKESFSPNGVPNFLISTGIPFMNKRCSELLELVSGGRYSIIFDTLSQTKAGEFRDKISIKTFDSKNLTNDRKQISGGQERLIDICVLLALNDLHSRIHHVDFNILILDEIFDSLDDNNISAISSLLSEVSKNKSINIITHTHIEGLNANRYFYL